MNPLERRTLGRTNVRVTCLGLGTGPLGGARIRVSDVEAGATVTAAVDAGINYFDTSPWYGVGQGELHLGRGLRGLRRPDHVVSTKVGRVLFPASDRASPPFAARWPGGAPNDLRFDYTRDGVLRSHEASLGRLGLDRVDALVIHDLDFRFHKDQAGVDARFRELEHGGGYETLRMLKSSGAIRAIGAGINHAGMIPRFLGAFDLDFVLVAMPYTLLDQPALDRELPMCLEAGVGVVVGAPYCSGLLAPDAKPDAWCGYRPAEALEVEKVGRMGVVAARHGVTLAAAALQFPLAHRAVAAVIPGPESAAHMHSNLALMEQAIPTAFWAELKHENLLRPDAPTP